MNMSLRTLLLLFLLEFCLHTMSLSVVTYNMQGHGPGTIEYLNKIMNINDVVLVQEHWLSSAQLLSLNNSISNAVIYGTSGMSDNKLMY